MSLAARQVRLWSFGFDSGGGGGGGGEKHTRIPQLPATPASTFGSSAAKLLRPALH